MKAFKTILFIFILVILLSFLLTGCGNNPKRGDDSTGQSITDDPEFTYPDGGKSITMSYDSLTGKFAQLAAAYECFKKCKNCTIIPCTPECTIICDYYDRLIISPTDVDKEIPAELRRLLKLYENGVRLKELFNYKELYSRHNSQKFYLMDANLDNIISNSDLMFKQALLQYTFKKDPAQNKPAGK